MAKNKQNAKSQKSQNAAGSKGTNQSQNQTGSKSTNCGSAKDCN